MVRMRVGLPVEVDQGPRDLSLNVVRINTERAIENGGYVHIPSHVSVAQCGLGQGQEVSRIQFQRPLQVVQAILEFSLATGDVPEQLVDTGFVRQTAPRDFEFYQGAIVVEVSMIAMESASE